MKTLMIVEHENSAYARIARRDPDTTVCQVGALRADRFDRIILHNIVIDDIEKFHTLIEWLQHVTTYFRPKGTT